jgi:hypothetical protein
MNICHHCKKEVTVERKVVRTDTCPHCNSDLRCCMNCSLYDAAVYNACRESQADRCVEKDRANFCVYFNFIDSDSKVSNSSITANKRGNPLDALFKKK